MKARISLLALLLAGTLPLTGLAVDDDQPPGAKTAASTPGQYIDDATITAKVKSAFFNDDKVNALDVKVTTYKGVVQLSGFADDRQVVARAEELAAAVNGVKSVKNDVRLKAD